MQVRNSFHTTTKLGGPGPLDAYPSELQTSRAAIAQRYDQTRVLACEFAVEFKAQAFEGSAGRACTEIRSAEGARHIPPGFSPHDVADEAPARRT